MTTGPEMHPQTQQPPHGHAPVEPPKHRNTVGIIALITAIVGAVFAMIPGALALGWILLPIAFVLSIVSLFLKNQKRGQGIAALIVSIVGTIIGFIVFLGALGSAVDEAFDEETQIEEEAEGDDVEESVVEDDEPAEADAENGTQEEGTRENPLALGATISEGDWEVTVNSVDLNATDAVLSENPLNDEPEEGNGYILADVSATYIGDDAAGDSPSGVRVEFVSSEGNSFDSTANMVIAPDYFNRSETLYEGASTSGNFVVEVPMDDVENGTLSVSPSMFGDGTFFAVQ